MKKIFLLLFIVFIGCSPKATKEALKIEQNNTIENEMIADNTLYHNDFYLEIENSEITKINQNELWENGIPIPYDIYINEIDLIKILKNGTITYNDNEYKIKQNDFMNEEIQLKVLYVNNLLGIYISEQTDSGGWVGYTLVINIENNKEILNVSLQEIRDSCLGFASMDNLFLVIYNTQIFSYDSINEDLLWRQTFLPANYNRMYIFYEDHFIIDELDGNEYKVYMDGRKEYIQGEPLNRGELNRRQSFNKIRYVRREEPVR